MRLFSCLFLVMALYSHGFALDEDDVRHRNHDRLIYALYGLVDPQAQPLLLEGIHTAENKWELKGSIIDPNSPHQKSRYFHAGGGQRVYRSISLDDFRAPEETIYTVVDRRGITVVRGQGLPHRLGATRLSMAPGIKWFAVVRVDGADGPELIRAGEDEAEPTGRYEIPANAGLYREHGWGVLVDGMSDDNKEELSHAPPTLLKARSLHLAPDGWPFGVGFWGEHEARDIVHIWKAQQKPDFTYPLPAAVIQEMTTEFGRRIAGILASEALPMRDRGEKPVPLGQVLQDAVLAEYEAVEQEAKERRRPFATVSQVLSIYRARTMPEAYEP